MIIVRPIMECAGEGSQLKNNYSNSFSVTAMMHLECFHAFYDINKAHINTQTHIYTNTHTQTHIYTNTCTNTHMQKRARAHTHIHTQTYTYT